MDDESLDEDLSKPVDGPLLSAVSVRGLFGRYDYTISVPSSDRGDLSRLLLLYGDNGSGKTTLLKLIWHLLSPADNKGHRTAISRTPFREFSVSFSDRSILRAAKNEGLLGSFIITLEQPGRDTEKVAYDADPETGRVTTDHSDKIWASEFLVRGREFAFPKELGKAARAAQENARAEATVLGFIASVGGNPIFLADDRSLYTDEQDLARAREREDVRQMDRAERSSAADVVERELRLTITRVNEMLRSLTLHGQSLGSVGANTIYGDVLRQLSFLPSTEATREPHAIDEPGAAEHLLNQLERDSPRFEEFGLTPHFAAQEFRELLAGVPFSRKDIANEILTPYLTSLKARIEALKEAETLVRTLLSILNDFLVDKQFTFTPRGGLRIVTPDGQNLNPRALSSGERQLTMLLCTTLLARRSSRIFIIDEPELSLGVPWQRQILAALLRLTDGTNLQFVVATHSVEMMSSERPNLVRLVRNSDELE